MAAFSLPCPLTLTATGQPAGGSLRAVPAGDEAAPHLQAAATFTRLTQGSPWSHRKLQHPLAGGEEAGPSQITTGSAGTPGQLSLLQRSPPRGRLPRMPPAGRSPPMAHLGLRSTAGGVSAGRCLCSVSGPDLGQLARTCGTLPGWGGHSARGRRTRKPGCTEHSPTSFLMYQHQTFNPSSFFPGPRAIKKRQIV